MDNLLIIHTLFDNQTRPYLDLFKVPSTLNNMLYISFNQCHHNCQSVLEPEEIDIILCPENRLGSADTDLLHQVSKAKKKIFLTLHQGDPERKIVKHQIEDIVGAKLQLPIREEIHNQGGAAFEMLSKLGLHHDKSHRLYQQKLNSYLTNFEFNLNLEAKFQVIHDVYDIEAIEDLFLNPESSEYSIDQEIDSLVRIPQIQNVLRKMMVDNSSDYSTRIEQLQQVFFKEHLSG